MAEGDPIDAGRRPTVIASHVDIVYRVMGASMRRPDDDTDDDVAALRRILQRGRQLTAVREIQAVSDVSFVAYDGQSIGIIGRNGSGKSTILRAIAGLLPPTSGRVWVHGRPALLGVNAVLMSKLTGERNIYIGGQALGLSKAEVARRMDEIVDFSGLGDAIHLPMSTYSSGMAARLRFAISTAAAPDVLMIDEALATGDAEFKARSAARIAQLREQAGTVFLVSHSNNTIRQMCDRALWMDRGRLVMDGPVGDVVDAYEAETKPRRIVAPKSKPEPIQDPDVPGVERWAARDRFVMATRMSARYHTASVRDVIVAPGEDIATTVACVAAAVASGSSLLMSRRHRVPSETLAEVRRLQPDRVTLIGTDDSLPESAVEEIHEATGVPVARIDAADPITLAATLSSEYFGAGVDTVFLALAGTGSHPLPAAAVCGARGSSLLLVERATLPDVVREELARLQPRRVVVVGSEEDIDDAVRRDAAQFAADGSERWSGNTVEELSAAVSSQSFEPGVDVAFVASGYTIGNAIAGVVAAATTESPLLLVAGAELGETLQTELARLRPTRIVVLGGPLSVSPDVRATVAQYLR